MNTTITFTGILSCLLLMLSITHSLILSGKDNDGEHHFLIERPIGFSSGKFIPAYQDEGVMLENSDEDEHEFEKRRFNAWAGKRNLIGKRRFNAWAGRR